VITGGINFYQLHQLTGVYKPGRTIDKMGKKNKINIIKTHLTGVSDMLGYKIFFLFELTPKKTGVYTVLQKLIPPIHFMHKKIAIGGEEASS